MRAGPLRRPLLAALLCAAAPGLLAGCEGGQMGFSGRDAEWTRARGPFSILSASSGRAVVSAMGAQVAVEPPPGFCLSEDGIETSDRGTFLLIGDCLDEAIAGAAPGADGGLDLPAGMPGVMTVSIAGDPGLSGGGLSEFESWLGTAEGRAMLGRGGDGAQVSIVETRRQGDTLYVLVEDRAAEAVPVFAPRFWRAFVEVNGRLAVASISGFRDVPMDESQMLRHLGEQVRRLQMANAVPVDEAPVQVAAAPRPPAFEETGSGDGPEVDFEVAEAEIADTPAEPPAGDAAWTDLQPAVDAADETETSAVVLAETPVVTAPDEQVSAVTAEAGNAPAAPSPAESPWAALQGGASDAAASPGAAWEEGAAVMAQAPVAAPAGDPAPAVAGPGLVPMPPPRTDEGASGWPGLQAPAAIETAGAGPVAAAEAAAPPDAGKVVEEDQPAARPMVVAATEQGGQGLWPMPTARPGAAAPGGQAEAGGDVPRPAPRLTGPAATVVPLPPRPAR